MVGSRRSLPCGAATSRQPKARTTQNVRPSRPGLLRRESACDSPPSSHSRTCRLVFLQAARVCSHRSAHRAGMAPCALAPLRVRPCACAGMAAEAAAFVRRVTSPSDGRPFLLYFAGTVPHTPFGLPASFEVNVTRTPAGPVPFSATWQARRLGVLRRLVNEGLVCKDYRQCHGRGGKALPEGGTDAANYEGAVHRLTSMAYKRPLALTDPWLDGSWLYTEPNFEQARLARLFASGLAWLDDSVGTVLGALQASGREANTMVVYSADHGASFLGKGHVYEAGIRVPLIVRWPAAVGRGLRTRAPAALLDLATTFLAAAGAPPEEASSLHGRSLLPLLKPGGEASAASAAAEERPIFIEIGYARAVVRGPWKLVVVNDAFDRCRVPRDGTCRNLHGELIDRYQCNFTANGHMGNRLVGACNMTYDAVARHAGFCDRRQLYHTEDDPLEQRNRAPERPELYDELLALIVQHARSAEPGNPALAGRPHTMTLRQCERGGGGGGAGGGGARRQRAMVA